MSQFLGIADAFTSVSPELSSGSDPEHKLSKYLWNELESDSVTLVGLGASNPALGHLPSLFLSQVVPSTVGLQK